MMPMYDPYSWIKQCHEEVLREAQLRLLAKQVKGDSRARFGLGRVGCALSGLLSLLR